MAVVSVKHSGQSKAVQCCFVQGHLAQVRLIVLICDFGKSVESLYTRKNHEHQMTTGVGNIVNTDYMEIFILTLPLFFLLSIFSLLFPCWCSSIFCSDTLTSFPSFSLLVSFVQDFSNDDTKLEYNVDADNGIAMEGYLFKRASNAFKTWNRYDRHGSLSIIYECF